MIILGALAACAALALWLLPTGQWLKAAVGWVDDLGPWGWVAFVLIYALFGTFAVPTSPLNIAAGLLFGAVSGFLAALAAASLSAMASFWIARHAARDWVLRRLSCHPKYSAAVHGLRHDSWKMILLTRLNPVLPGAIANYCFGITTVRFRTYATASLVGNAPLCFLLAYLGSAGQLTFGGEKHKPTPAEWALYAGGLAATVALTWWVTRYTRRKLREYEEQQASAMPATS